MKKIVFKNSRVYARRWQVGILTFVSTFLLVLSSIAIGEPIPRGHGRDNKGAKSSGEGRIEAESRFATLDGARIHYANYNRDSGARGKGKAKAGNDEEALVLIHGWTMNNDSWRAQIPALVKRNRVIAIDLPGHGQSDKPQTTYNMDYFARAVDAVMRDAKVKRAVLVGHSMGTPIARQFYRKYPDKTIAIVIVDGSLRPFGDKAILDKMIAGLRSPAYRETGTQMFTMMSGPGLAAEAKDRIMSSFANTPQHVVVSAMEGMADPAIWTDDKINVPVLAVMAKNPFFPPNLEESFRALVPNMEFYMWNDVGHFLHMERPQEFNQAVLQFLDKNKLLL
ncbi:MAG TPA: alpha/beta hydrolase [Pyrinomonadaceae bacterium]|nr:alpha/beta hydrolase [Pyrinomonadaceae bacterium]